ncbi:hypothetical protein DFH06DRAFT_1123751 [Mycena polygramma]|nr:hypothetical protein DFH06DRAFT_1123751 [Mycena polygramma]
MALVGTEVPNDLHQVLSYTGFKLSRWMWRTTQLHCARWDYVSTACALCAPMLAQLAHIVGQSVSVIARADCPLCCSGCAGALTAKRVNPHAEDRERVSLSTPAERPDLSAMAEGSENEMPCGSRAPACGEVRPWIGLRASRTGTKMERAAGVHEADSAVRVGGCAKSSTVVWVAGRVWGRQRSRLRAVPRILVDGASLCMVFAATTPENIGEDMAGGRTWVFTVVVGGLKMMSKIRNGKREAAGSKQ